MSLDTEEKGILAFGCVTLMLGVAFYGVIILGIILAINKWVV